MTDLFLDILNTSFAATWVVLAVVLARLLLKKAPRSLVCGLWVLVAVRLLWPGGIEAPFSLIPSAEIIPPESLFDQAPAIQSGLPIVDNIVNPVYSESLRADPTASVNPLQIWLAVFANLWVLGMAAMAIWAALSCLRVRKQVRESVPAEEGVFLCDRIDSPFIFGLFRPKIYLPSDLDADAASHVLAHERAHLRRRDHWWKPLGFLLLTVNWFNPILWLAYVLLCRDIEMACDEHVVRALSIGEKKAYSTALLRCSTRHRHITVCPLAFGEVGVKQRIRSVLHYKKPAFWVILVTAVLTIVLAAGLLTDPLSPKPEIRWDGVLYIQDGRPLKALPADAQSVGSLRSVLHDQIGVWFDAHPNENSQSVHLSWEYAGQSLYLTDGMLYIEEPGGKGWLPFVKKHSPADVLAVLDRQCQIELSLEDNALSIHEFIRDYSTREDPLHLRELLASENLVMKPTLDWDHSMLAINYVDNITIIITPSDYDQHCLLVRREADWLLLYRDDSWAVTAWTFECPELDAALVPWQNELAFSAELFSEFATVDDPIHLQYNTANMEEIALRIGIPTHGYGTDPATAHWQWGAQTSYTDSTIHIRSNPFGKEDWLEIIYIDSREELYFYASQEEPITLPNGATGTLYHSGDPERWCEIVLDTTRGRLRIQPPNVALQFTDWKTEDYRMALAILGTLSITENGNSLFGAPAPSEKEEPYLGISLRAEEVTCWGLQLIYSQEGGSESWKELVTSPEFTLEKWVDESWQNVMPADIGWEEVLYRLPTNGTTAFNIDFRQTTGLLEEGLYRIGKTFYGNPESVAQTCYAEFYVNPLGITLSVTDVTRNGARLICTQDGTLWDSITTGAPWNLEQWTDDGWVSVMPESTVWTTIAYLVNQGQTNSWNLNWNLIVGSLGPGQYRVSKTFWGEHNPPFTLGLEGEEIRQTCYAEFTIE